MENIQKTPASKRCRRCIIRELAVQNAQLGVLVEEMQAVRLESNLHGVAGAGRAARIDAGNDVALLAVHLQVEIGLGAHQLDDLNLRLDEVVVRDGQEALKMVEVN